MYRLKNKADFAAVFAAQLLIRQGDLLLLYNPNHKQYPRLGVIIKKRLVAKATARNYLKRLIRSSFCANLAVFAGFDLIVLLSNSYKQHKQLCFKQELNKLWQHGQQKLLLPL